MEMAFLATLEKWKPLWDFLTAIGTVGAVILSLFLAFGRLRTRYQIQAKLIEQKNERPQIIWEITNLGDVTPLLAYIYWYCPCIPKHRIPLPMAVGTVNGLGPLSLPKPLQKYDTFSSWKIIDEFVQLINEHIPANWSIDRITLCIAKSRFGCTTNNGRSFEKKPPNELGTR